jgi:predicted metal-dependent HD superfamily phosphohydrolase
LIPPEETLLEELFKTAASRYGKAGEAVESAWDTIRYYYSSPDRFYHNFDHLRHFCRAIELLDKSMLSREEILFSVFYHDVIYRPLEGDNEEQSAGLAVAELEKLGAPQFVTKSVAELVMATKQHEGASGSDINNFLDADLAILGEDKEKYHEYARLIRLEYHQIPDDIYKPGRHKVLSRFLTRQTIYKSSLFQRERESKARENIMRELKGLEGELNY